MSNLSLFALVLILLGGLVPTGARAFCIVNQTDVPLHAESLGSDGFAVDIPAADRACCAAGQCTAPTTLLVVSGYVPVTEGRPGWQAECRARIAPGGQVTVIGTLKKITCNVGGGS
ncbi:hypothetical protein JCM17960_12160 [Magnetospira thiophila]